MARAVKGKVKEFNYVCDRCLTDVKIKLFPIGEGKVYSNFDCFNCGTQLVSGEDITELAKR